MTTVHRRVVGALVLAVLAAVQSSAQSRQWTRFTIAAAPIVSQPKGDFSNNIGVGAGATGALLYRLDSAGLLSLRIDVSGQEYGRETTQVPLSETVGGRIAVDLTTTNTIAALGIGPELALPQGWVRPYLNAGVGGLFFRTTSFLRSFRTFEERPIATTTNFSDNAGLWALGAGARIPLGGLGSRLSLDLGVRYQAGGQASYLREGSIQDNPDGTISFIPLSSRTPLMTYLIGVRYQIPYTSAMPCHRFIC